MCAIIVLWRGVIMKLTNEEKIIVEKNHNLIYSFANNKGLKVEEWYGVLAEALCVTSMVWVEGGSTFAYLFYKIAENSVKNAYRDMNRDVRSANIKPISLDVLFSIGCVEDNMDYIEVLDVLQSLDPEMSEIIDMRLRGLTQNEISEITGMSQASVSYKLKSLIEKYNDYKKSIS